MPPAIPAATVKPDTKRPPPSSLDDGSSSDGGVQQTVDKHIYIARSVRLHMINWWHVASLYVPWVIYAVLTGVVLATANDLRNRGVTTGVLKESLQPIVAPAWEYVLLNRIMVGVGACVFLMWCTMQREQPVYLVDFSVFQPPTSWQVSHEDLVEIMNRTKKFGEDQLAFMSRVLVRSETGQATHWPPSVVAMLKDESLKIEDCASMSNARAEARTVMFGVLNDLLEKTSIAPKDIDFLIINCSLFSPTPSLCAMVHNHFKLRQDCRTYNLSGMGCSAGVISIDLAKQLLQARPNSTAVVISTENLTQQLYLGKEKSMLLQNTLFRCGGAAIALSNKRLDGFRAKYKLLHTVRTQNSNDDAYACVYETEDTTHNRGIRLSKEVTKIAGRALAANLTILGPHVLPLREQAKVLATIAGRRVTRWLFRYMTARGWKGMAAKLPEFKTYVPDFKRGLHHFCIHAGGRAVIDGIEKNLSLSPADTEPSRNTLRDFGNTSSSSIWYELAFIEKAGNIGPGERVMQIAFGSGFKCNSAVWLRMRTSSLLHPFTKA